MDLRSDPPEDEIEEISRRTSGRGVASEVGSHVGEVARVVRRGDFRGSPSDPPLLFRLRLSYLTGVTLGSFSILSLRH